MHENSSCISERAREIGPRVPEDLLNDAFLVKLELCVQCPAHGSSSHLSGYEINKYIVTQAKTNSYIHTSLCEVALSYSKSPPCNFNCMLLSALG